MVTMMMIEMVYDDGGCCVVIMLLVMMHGGCHGEAAAVWLPERMGGAWPEVSWWIGEIRRWSSFLVLAGKSRRKSFPAAARRWWPAMVAGDGGGAVAG
ncbi:hypothetical protein Tco_0301010 [Tanacetum coccineum]